jgi:hypothetical protein
MKYNFKHTTFSIAAFAADGISLPSPVVYQNLWCNILYMWNNLKKLFFRVICSRLIFIEIHDRKCIKKRVLSSSMEVEKRQIASRNEWNFIKLIFFFRRYF